MINMDDFELIDTLCCKQEKILKELIKNFGQPEFGNMTQIKALDEIESGNNTIENLIRLLD